MLKMRIQKELLYFVGHQGLMNDLYQEYSKIMYVPDSNLVLALIQKGASGKNLSAKHNHYLSVSKERVHQCWHLDREWIPVNPILALMELSKQHHKPEYANYLRLHKNFFTDIYSIDDVAPEWIASTYIAAMRAYISTHPSILKTIKKVYSLIPSSEKPSNNMILSSCEELFNWIWAERANLTLIGGPLMYICVYAIAGSPDAREFIKHSKASRGNIHKIAENVAWDFLYWVMMEIEYHRNGYQDTIVCTSDRSLAQLLASRINKGPRSEIATIEEKTCVDSFGDFFPFKLSRIENTKLEREISGKLVDMLLLIENVDKNSIKFGFN